MFELQVNDIVVSKLHDNVNTTPMYRVRGVDHRLLWLIVRNYGDEQYGDLGAIRHKDDMEIYSRNGNILYRSPIAQQKFIADSAVTTIEKADTFSFKTVPNIVDETPELKDLTEKAFKAVHQVINEQTENAIKQIYGYEPENKITIITTILR